MTTFPKNQPIIFEPYLPDACNCDDATFRLLAKTDDYCQFQVKVAACANVENVLCNADFDPAESVECLETNWIVAGGFSIDTHEACCDLALGTITQAGSLIIGNPYQLEVNITSLSGTLYVFNGAVQIAELNQLGVNIFMFTALTDDVSLQILNANHSVCVASVNAKPLSLDMGFGIINPNGTTLDYESYSSAPSFFKFASDTVTITFQWSHFDVEPGLCYTVGFADGCTNLNAQFGIFNSDFQNCLTGWTATMGTLITIGCLQLENPETADIENVIEFTTAAGVGNIKSFATSLTIGKTYTVTIGAMSTDADGLLRIYCGTANDDFLISGESHTIVCTGNTDFKIEAVMNTSTYIRLWDFTLSIEVLSQIEFDYESYPFKIAQNECTHLINISNDDDGMGFVFIGSNFAPMIRLESEIVNSVPEILRESYHDNNGKKKTYFGEYRKAFVFNIDYVPAWVVDFLCICFIADHFLIDGVEYFIEGDGVETAYPENVCYSNMTPIKFTISEKTQLARNADIGNVEQILSLYGASPITAPDGSEVIALFGGTVLTER